MTEGVEVWGVGGWGGWRVPDMRNIVDVQARQSFVFLSICLKAQRAIFSSI